MVETIQKNGLWHTTLVEKDLIEQAGFNQKDFEQDFGFFKYKGRVVIISHIFNKELVVSMVGKEDEDMKNLINGLSKVVGYQPFCKYSLTPSGNTKIPSLPTYEWDKVDPNSRYRELSQKKNISNLTKLL